MNILYINKFNDNAINIRPNPLYKVIFIYICIYIQYNLCYLFDILQCLISNMWSRLAMCIMNSNIQNSAYITLTNTLEKEKK